jgi:hypothetical protein
VYYQLTKDGAHIAFDLSLLPNKLSAQGYDQVGLAHLLTVYGYRPAKCHTIYNGAKRLGVGEVAHLVLAKVKITKLPYRPLVEGRRIARLSG